MKQDLTWGWAFGCVAALAIQTALMVLVAPWFAGWVHRLAGRLVGEPRFPAGGRWQEIWHQFRRPSLYGRQDGLNGVFCALALVLAVLACGLVPVFTLTMPGFPAPGMLLVCTILVAVGVLLDLPQAVQEASAAQQGCAAIVADALLLPVLTPVLLLTGAHDLVAFLGRLHVLSPITEGAPYVLAGVALFLATALARRDEQTASATLSGPDKAMWLLAADCMQMCWVTLAADVAWAGSLAMPGESGAENWLTQCVEGLGLWMFKLLVASFMLAVLRMALLPAGRRARVRLGAIFLLGVLAWQVTSSHVATPPAEPENHNVEDENTQGYSTEPAPEGEPS